MNKAEYEAQLTHLDGPAHWAPEINIGLPGYWYQCEFIWPDPRDNQPQPETVMLPPSAPALAMALKTHLETTPIPAYILAETALALRAGILTRVEVIREGDGRPRGDQTIEFQATDTGWTLFIRQGRVLPCGWFTSEGEPEPWALVGRLIK